MIALQRRLAAKFGLLLLTDERGKQPARYIVGNETPKSVIDTLPKGHWCVRRFNEPPRLVPRHAV